MRYTFPLYDGISVVGFVCTIGDRVITGKVQERDQARNTYEEAVSKGDAAAVLEQMVQAADVFTCSIGNVGPGETVVVDITYVGELKHDSEVDGIRFTIPTNIAPRYSNSMVDVHPPDNVESQKRAFEVVVDAEFPDGAAIREIRSPSHPVAVSLGTTSVAPTANPSLNRASATLSLGDAELDQDFVLQVVAKEAEIPKALLETHPTIPGQRALMTTLVPKFALTPERPELVFICDRSGSMSGFKITTLVNALVVFLKSLPAGVKFNICSFGTSHKFLWDKSKAYSESSLNEAIRHVESFEANLGGTEMLGPVKDTLDRRYKDMPLDVFLVTDGQIWNSAELFNYLNNEIQVNKAPVRIFTLGIGNDVSHSLIEGVARAGNGFSQAVGNKEKFESKVVRMLKAGLTPHITDYTLEVKYDDEDGDFELVEKVTDSLKVKLAISDDGEPLVTDVNTKAPAISLFDSSANPDAPIPNRKDKFAGLPAVEVPQLLQTPQEIPPLYAFTRTTVYIIMAPTSSQKAPSSVILRGTSPQGPLSLEIPVAILSEAGTTIHQLAARKAIQELEESRGWLTSATVDGDLLLKKYPGRFADMVEMEAVRLGVKFQVQSRWTSFVAVKEIQKERQEDDEKEYELLEGLPGTADAKFERRSEAMADLCQMSQNIGFLSQNVEQSVEGFMAAPRDLSADFAKARYKSKRKSASPFGAIGAIGSGISRGFGGMFGGSAASSMPPPVTRAIHSTPAAAPMGFGSSVLGSVRSQKEKMEKMEEGGVVKVVAALHGLISLQTFEGFWEWKGELFSACGVTEKDVDAKYEAWMVEKNVLATALAIRYLEVALNIEKDTWELIVDKAKAWVQSKIGDEGLRKVCSAVDGLIKTTA